MRMRDHGFHQRFRQATPAVRLQHKYISEIREGCIVGNYSRETDLLRAVVNPETERIRDRTRDHFAWHLFRPIRLRRKKIVDDLEVEPRAVGADEDPIDGTLERRAIVRRAEHASVGCTI